MLSSFVLFKHCNQSKRIQSGRTHPLRPLLHTCQCTGDVMPHFRLLILETGRGVGPVSCGVVSGR